MADPIYKDVHVQLSGEDGNIFFILGRCTSAMRHAGYGSAEQQEFANRLQNTPSYDAALQLVMATFETS